VRLDPAATRVRARLAMRPNPARAGEGRLDLRLDGEAMRLVAAAIDGAPVPANALAVDEAGLTVAGEHLPDGGFVWECETEIAPATTPRSRGSTCRRACTAPSARPRGSARSPSTPTGRT
jgi:aminopeptidase N